jgi:DNA primase
MIQDEVRYLADKYLKKVRPTGPDNITATCPFHRKADGSEEKHPSFSMSLTKGVYYCFACGSSGNLYTFLRDMGLPKLTIQQYYGTLIDELKKRAPRRIDPIHPDVIELAPMEEAILGFFDYCPVQMVDEFGFPEELLRKMDVGFDPKHNRITFPLRDYKGNLLGVSGRDVIGQGPRFKVYTDEYEAYGYPARSKPRKGIILWNADRVYPAAYFAKNAFVVMVEGFKACLRVLQAGFNNTIAALGKNVSEHQQWILESMGATVYIFFDNDVAGQQGLEKTAKQLSKSLKVMIVEYEAQQPSDLDVDQVRECIAKARNYYSWAINKER